MKKPKKDIEISRKNNKIGVSIDTFNKDEVTNIFEVIKICKNIKDERIEIDLDYYKNIEFAVDYGYSPDDIRAVIHSLNASDLHAGPVADRNSNFKHYFWIFIKYLEDIKIKVYIKLKIVNHKLKINVFRFHKEGMHNEN